MRGGKKVKYSNVLFIYKKNDQKQARLGLAVSRKYGGAIDRNYFKRVAKEVFRRHPMKHLSIDILLIPVGEVSQNLHDLFDEGFQKVMKV
ncbi:MAG: ribonuclease P protein component [Zetaproteobacteria bacterium]|nr:ribonuclease P protein component [Zetaproteobacteria bacterium]